MRWPLTPPNSALSAVFSSKDVQNFVRAPMAQARRMAPPVPFSVVMPSFNQARFIERSLNSVLNQEYGATELIVMDGASQDGTGEILEKYSKHIAFWRSEPDQGQSDALNSGFRVATGELCGWLNSDDLYLPGALQHAAQIFAEHPEIQVVYGDWLTIDETDRVIERLPALAPSRTRLVTEGFFCNAQAMFWRRSLHSRLGDFDLQLHYTMDYDLMLRMISVAGPRAFFRTDRPLGCFRVYEGQKTGSTETGAYEKVCAEHRRIAERAGTEWKYAFGGRALRLAYRLKRGAEFLGRGRSDYLLGRVKNRFGA